MAPLVLSNSRSNTFRRCQKQYEFKYVEKLKPKRVKLPLRLGDWLHQLLMVHADGHDWHERHAELRVDFDKLFDEEKEELGDLPTNAERLMRGYLANYRDDSRLFRTVDTEINEIVELPNGMQINVIIDKIAEDLVDHGLWVWDYKVVGRFFPPDFMLIDSQLALYFWAAAHKLGYRNLRGSLLDEMISKPPTLPARLESGKFSCRKNLHCDAFTFYSCIKQDGQDPRDYATFLRFLRSRHNEWWRRTRMPRDPAMVNQVVREMMRTGQDIQRVVKREEFTRTARKECQWDCDYLMPCMAQLQGSDLEHIIRIHYRRSKRPDEEDLSKIWPGAKEVTHGSK